MVTYLISAILIFCCSWFYKCSCCCCPGSHQQKAGSQKQHPTEKGSTPFCMSTPHQAFLCMSKPLYVHTPPSIPLSMSKPHQAVLSVYIYTSPCIPLCMSKLQQTFFSIHPHLIKHSSVLRGAFLSGLVTLHIWSSTTHLMLATFEFYESV